jgi:hypothetical protein
MLEEYAVLVLLVGLGIAAVAYLWLLVAAFRASKGWGFASLLLPPLALVFLVTHPRKSAGPLVLGLVAGGLLAAPYAVNYYNARYVSLGPREKTVDGELHLTLTGWDETDYSVLDNRPQTVVLQIANPDVTDRTLDHIRGMDQLREVDLNDTQVTDEGLAILAALPRLVEVRLARTKISDAGFRKYLAGKESLLKLDLTGTKVLGKTRRDWKKARAGREYLD